MPVLPDNTNIKKSKRARRMSIRVRHDGSVTMTVPYFTPTSLARKFLNSKSDWVNQQLSQIKSEQHSFANGQVIGKAHRIIFQCHEGPLKSTVRNNLVVISIPHGAEINDPLLQKTAKNAVFRALRKEARAYLPKRLDTLAGRFGFIYEEIRLKNASTRWGSCSNAKNINLNIQLMRLPHHLIDYVIVHELCHLKHQNHSQDFWYLLETILPEAKEHRKELRSYSILYRD